MVFKAKNTKFHSKFTCCNNYMSYAFNSIDASSISQYMNSIIM